MSHSGPFLSLPHPVKLIGNQDIPASYHAQVWVKILRTRDQIYIQSHLGKFKVLYLFLEEKNHSKAKGFGRN